MPKKTKKGRRSVPAPAKRNGAAANQATPASTSQTRMELSAAATRPSVARAASAAKVDLAQEYRYVFTDLRKIAIIALVMFALLFALAFVLK